MPDHQVQHAASQGGHSSSDACRSTQVAEVKKGMTPLALASCSDDDVRRFIRATNGNLALVGGVDAGPCTKRWQTWRIPQQSSTAL